jgi:hypothetical protein
MQKKLNPFYAGIGSEKTPAPVLQTMFTLAQKMGELGFTLRSGGAEGADTAFEEGAEALGFPCEIFLPEAKFKGHPSPLHYIPAEAYRLAQQHHPAWGAVKSQLGRNLLARDGQQILGASLNSPVAFVLCWTPDGAEQGNKTSIDTGGTGQAIRIASAYSIPVFNLKNKTAITRLHTFLSRIYGVTP